jgi:putative two-component system response regulator
MKYETLLHYNKDTILELDADQRVFHALYNPDPDFEELFTGSSYQAMIDRSLNDMIHPDDRPRVKEIFDHTLYNLYQKNMQKIAFQCSVRSPTDGGYHLYRITILRVFTGHSLQRLLLVVLHRSSSSDIQPQLPDSPLPPSTAPGDLVSSVLRCRMDPCLTLLDGTNSLFSLTGFRPEEIRTQFNNELLNMVLPEDRTALMEKVHHAARRGGKTELTYRLLCKHSASVWVLGKIRFHGEIYGSDTFYHTLTDISYYINKQKDLQERVLCDQILREITGAILFDWNLSTDKLYCSSMWEKRFGYPPMQENFTDVLASATHFHPDDTPLIRNIADRLRKGDSVPSVDVRIADKESIYHWYKMTCTLRLRKEVRHIIGLLTDIDTLKKSALSLQDRADRDSLTQLYNKSFTQWLINDYLSRIHTNEWAGLLILDLDNFKTVNDTYGHLYGDALLTQVGTTLRKLFRAQDIIGRIGGDEFLILLKDVPHAYFLQTRCNLLLNAFRDLLGRLMPDLEVTCSIGGAIYPIHGGNYSELFQHADAALYNAKNQGKDCFCIYDPKSPVDLLSGPGRVSHTTRVDSDEGPAVSDDAFIRFVFQRLYESRDVLTTIDEVLAFIGARFNVSRVYIFENIDNGRACCNTFEWCNAGIPAMKDQLQYLSYEDDLPGWQDHYDENGMFYCTDITKLPDSDRAVLEPQGIKSMLHCQIYEKGVFRGYMGFDECTYNRLWTQVQVSSLAFLTGVLGTFLFNERNSRAAQSSQSEPYRLPQHKPYSHPCAG